MAANRSSKRRGPKTVARSYFDAIGDRDLEAMAEHFAPGAVGRVHGIVELRIPDTYLTWFGNLFRAFPDLRMEIVELVGAGELAAVRWHATGTFNGSTRFEGLVPTGARSEIEGCDMLRISDGLIEENNAYMNGAELARQLGALPPAGSLADRAMLAALNARTAATAAIRRLRQPR